MRFSSLFQLPVVPQQPAAPQAEAARAEAGAMEPAPLQASPAAVALPEDLDARVRLVGEWQLGDAY